MTEPTQPTRPDQPLSVDPTSTAPPAEDQSPTGTTPPSPGADGSPADAPNGGERRVAADETTTGLPSLTLPALPPLTQSSRASQPASARPSGAARVGYAPPIAAAEVSAALRGPAQEKEKAEKKAGLLGVSGNQILAGALAASTSAVAASYLGVAGTVMGAGLGSVIATVSTAVYQKSIQHSRPLLQKVTTTVVGKNGELQDVVSESRASHLAPDPSLPTATQVGTGLPDPHLAETPRAPARSVSGQHPPAGASPYEETVPVMTPALPNGRAGAKGAAPPPNRPTGKVYGGGPWYAGLPWKRIAVASAVVFVLAMGTLMTIEFFTGRPIADAVQGKKGNGTTIGHLVGEDSSTSSPAPSETDTGEPTPTDTPSEDVSPSDSSAPTDQAPTDETNPTDTSEPTEQPAESPAATDDQAADPSDSAVPQPQVETNTTPSPSASLLR